MSQCAEFPNDNPKLHRGVIWVCLDTTGAPTADRSAVPVPEPVIEAIEVSETAIIEAIAAVEPVETIAIIEIIEETSELDPVAAAIEAAIAATPIVDEDPCPSDVIAAEIALALTENRPSGIIAIAHDDEDDEPIVVEEIEPLGDVETITAAAVSVVVAAMAVEEEEAPPTVLDDPFHQLCCALADVATAASAPEAAAALTALLLDGRVDGALSPEVRACLTEGGIADGDRVTETFAATARAWRAILLGTSDDLSACGAATLDEWAADLVARLLGAPQRATVLKRELRSRGVAAWGLIAA